ncbi:MAG TPA: hypothetical protein VF765_08950 [Polyangiaceae bacterium]
MRILALLGVLAGLAACGGSGLSGGDDGEGTGTEGADIEGSPTMQPGQNCLSCHSSGEHTFTAAGTVFSHPDDPVTAGVGGVVVLITDAHGTVTQLVTNSAGNFYTDAPLVFPITAELHRGSSVMRMAQTVPIGGCSTCHNQPPAAGAPGRNYVAP